jgi:hypothetical protein
MGGIYVFAYMEDDLSRLFFPVDDAAFAWFKDLRCILR